jgi:hypothetical protein
MHVAHGACNPAGRDIENPAPPRRVEVAVCADLDLPIAALLDERGQPADLQLAADDDQEVRLLQLENEAGLGFDEVGILVASGDRFHGDAIAAGLERGEPSVIRLAERLQILAQAIFSSWAAWSAGAAWRAGGAGTACGACTAGGASGAPR